MGQGEPLYNYKNVSNAISILTSPMGFGMGKGKITISTSGIIPLIEKIATDLKVGLAISLHAPSDELRSAIMAINKTYPLADLIKACKSFSKLATCSTKRVTFEYVMLDGVNDSKACLADLVALVRNLNCHINLIPFNPWPGSPFSCSPRSVIEKFQAKLQSFNISASIRESRGSDILAACGQLKSSVIKE